MASIFVSYSRNDDAFVKRLVKDLRASGINVWLDQDNIAPGQRWDMAIERALDAASHILFVMSQASTQSENVRDELDTAIDSGKTILPVLIDDCKPPLRVRRMQYTDFRKDYAAGLANLLSMLGIETADAPQPQNSTPPAAAKSPARASGSKILPLLAALIVIGGLAAVLAYLRQSGSASTSTVTLTQTPPVITQVAAAPTGTATLLPATTVAPTRIASIASSTASSTGAAGEPATAAPTVNTSCADALPTRLAVKSKGRVTPGGDPSRLRSGPGRQAQQLGLVQPGEAFDVLDGPQCADQIVWWRVQYQTQVGWIAEGQTYYFLEPLDPFDTFLTNLVGWHAARGKDGALSKWQDGKAVKLEGIWGDYSPADAFYLSDDTGTDFVYEGDVTLEKSASDGSAAGLAFRTGADPFASGYVVAINLSGGGQVKLLKYPPSELASYATPVRAGKTVHVKIAAAGSSIKVYLDNDSVPIIDASDATYQGGRFGLYVYQSSALFQSIYRHALN